MSMRILSPTGLDLTLPPQWFQYQWAQDPVPDRTWCWDTTAAVDIQRAMRRMYPDHYRNAVITHPVELFKEPIEGNTVNHEYAMTVNEENPIIGVFLPEPIRGPEGHRVGVIIDGCHRLYKRHVMGLETVDVFLLPDEVEESIRFPEAKIQQLREFGLL